MSEATRPQYGCPSVAPGALHRWYRVISVSACYVVIMLWAYFGHAVLLKIKEPMLLQRNNSVVL